MPIAPEVQVDGSTLLRPQPVFCLVRTELADDLQAFIESGGRKIGAWTARHRQIKLGFDAQGDDTRAFANINTLDELHDSETP
jgi:molybdopterin-guanine dinucleotide biosynthesis protein A